MGRPFLVPEAEGEEGEAATIVYKQRVYLHNVNETGDEMHYVERVCQNTESSRAHLIHQWGGEQGGS